MKQGVAEKMREIVGNDYVIDELTQLQGYLYDETEPKIRPTANEDCLVVKPGSTEEISQIVKYANEVLIPIVPRGGGTNVCGAAIPIVSSIILSMERINKTIEVDEENLMITVDAGVTLAEMLEKLKDVDKLFFPVHPGDEGAHIGGMVIENAGGVRAVKHGIMRNHIKGLEVVLPTGEIVNLGGKLIKNNMGYDLLHLMIGSEGTLGIVTKCILKLYAENNNSGTLVISFDTREDAATAASKILQNGITPLAIEYLEKEIAFTVEEHLGTKWPAREGLVDLLIIMNEGSEDDLFAKSERIVEICEACNAVDSLIAESSKDQRNILEIRSNVYTAYSENIADGIDIAVPPASVPDFIREMNEIAIKYDTTTPACGHIGDGNIHNFVMLDKNGEFPAYYDDILSEFYSVAIKYGGTITAEHGTGKTRVKYMGMQFSDAEINLVKGIKQVFDPNGIMNPGTIVAID
jgi:glycolate oxidase